MDGKQRALRGGEVRTVENKAPNEDQVVVEIRGEETSKTTVESSPRASESCRQSKACSESTTGFSRPAKISCPSPEISRFSRSRSKPPKIPTTNENLTQRRSQERSVYSKPPKSKFGEQPYSSYGNVCDENGSSLLNNKLSGSAIRRVPLMASPGQDAEEEIYKLVKLKKEKHRRVKIKALVELITFVSILGCLVASLTAERLKILMVWGLEFWKWCVLVMVIFSGMLVTNWFMHVVVFLIERNFLLRKKVLYFVHGLKKSVQVYIWLSLVLLTCVLLVNHGVKRSKTATKLLGYVTRTLVSFLVGSFLWLMKTLLLKILASNFHVNTFFDRIQESIFHQYVLQTLSGHPLIEEAESVGKSVGTGRLTFTSTKKKISKGNKEVQVIDIGKLHKMKHGKVSAWTMKVLVDAVMSSGLSTISHALDESVDDEGGEQTDKEITSEMEATAAAYYIFINVARPDCKYINEDDLLRFMVKEEVDLVFPLLEGEAGRIDRKDLSDWVVKVYKGRKALAHALNDTKTAVKQLNKIVTVILIVVTTLVWLLLMEIATTKVLLFLSSQLVVVAFIFGNTCKTIFEAIIFVFVMHPFDVGDRCVIDDIPMMVEEMNILTTVFLKLDNEKIYYPNSVLATKPISNYYRSPDMTSSVEFSVDYMTPVDRIGMLKDKITQLKTSSSFSPLATILNQNKLTGPNYVDWKRNLDIVLIAEGHKFVLTQPCPEFPALDTSQEDNQRYDRWNKSNEMAKCYILASLSNVLQHQMQAMPLASDIMFNLKEMFGDQGRAARQDIMRSLLNSRMTEGTQVRDHCLKMIAWLNELKVLGAEIDIESQVHMVLQSLPESFNQLKLNVSMNKKSYTLYELMNEIVAGEGILKAKASVNMAQASTSKSQQKGEGEKKRKATKQVGKQVALEVNKVGNKAAKAKAKGKCFHCNKTGHLKRNCPEYLATKQQGVPRDQKIE